MRMMSMLQRKSEEIYRQEEMESIQQQQQRYAMIYIYMRYT